MKKYLIGILSTLIVLSSFKSARIDAGAGNKFVEPVKMRVTCYTATGNPTATGVMPFEGGCAAKRDWMGDVAVVYTLEGEFVAYLDINDTGGHGRIKDSSSIDVYRDTLAGCYEWVEKYGDYMLVQILPDAKG